MTKTPSRILNEKPNFLGLEVFDLVVLAYTLIFTHEVLKLFGLGLLAIPLLAILIFFLIGIRTKYRSKIIRDYLFFKMNKYITGVKP